MQFRCILCTHIPRRSYKNCPHQNHNFFSRWESLECVETREKFSSGSTSPKNHQHNICNHHPLYVEIDITTTTLQAGSPESEEEKNHHHNICYHHHCHHQWWFTIHSTLRWEALRVKKMVNISILVRSTSRQGGGCLMTLVRGRRNTLGRRTAQK